MLTESSLFEKGKIIAKLVGKYASTSVIATAVDFTVFHFVMTNGGISAVQSTIIGRLSGALIAFMLHRAWVFQKSDTPQYRTLIFKYIMGILLGMGLNVAGVWFLNTVIGIDAWTSRVVAAATVWSLVFFYNKHVVFKEKIVADQDFAEIEAEEEELFIPPTNTL